MPHDLDRPVIVRGLDNYPDFRSGQLPPSHPGLTRLLQEANLDPQNPFRPWIEPGMRVLVKPNWVRHATEGWSTMEALTTHPSLLRPIVEYVARSNDNSSRVIILGWLLSLKYGYFKKIDLDARAI